MNPPDDRPACKPRKAMVQKLEGLQRAGVTHLRKPRPVEPAAPQAPAAPPQSRGQPQAVVAPTAPAPASAPAPSPQDRVAALARVAREVAACTRCAELARTRTQTVFGSGNPHARLVFIGEAPGADEDRAGLPFVGAAGQKLTEIIENGMKLRRQDVYIMNILRCRPPGNRTPLPDEAANCRPFLDRQLDIIRPEFICCLGACAAQNLLGTTTPIGQMRGRPIEFRGMKVVCTYHPAYLLRNPSARRQVWDDIQALMAAMGLPLPGKGGK